MIRSILATAAVTAALLIAGSTPVRAQEDSATTPAPVRRNEFGVQQVVITAGYSSQRIPESVSNFRDPTFLGQAASVNASAEIRWLRSGKASYFDLRYTPQAGVQVHDQTLRDLNQIGTAAFHLNPRRSKWRLAAVGSGQVQTSDEALFAPSSAQSAAENGASFRELSDATLHGSGASPASDIPTAGLTPDLNHLRVLFGRRTASVGGAGTITYARSARFSAAVTFGGMSVQHLSDPSDLIGFSYPDTTARNVSGNLTYGVSRRTDVGFSANAGRAKSTVATQSGQSGRVFVNHTMRRRIFFQLSGGAGTGDNGSARQLTAVYSVGIGVKLARHTIMASTLRDVVDSYTVAAGVASSSFTATTGAWHWASRRQDWTTSLGMEHFLDAPPGQPATHTWNARATVSRHFARQFALLVQYAGGKMGSRRYIQDGRQYQMSKSGLRISLAWVPERRRAR